MVDDLDAAPFPDRPVVPFGKPVHDRLRLEVSRGCTRGCRFCQAGMLYRPVRERTPEKVFELAARALAATGYEDLSLLSLSTGDYGCIVPLMQRLMGRFASERVAVSLPSLRAGTLSPELMELIRQVRKTGFTFAPEAGSQRLRDVINKNISEAEITATVRDAFQMGWQLVKLYFMVGLPTETDEDLQALVDLALRFGKLKGPAGRRGQINVSVATFIPKPHTPFQWASQITLGEARDKLGWIQERLKTPGIEVKWQNPEMSLLEGVWARGDRRLGRVLQAAHRRGCRFDGWGDQLNFGAWLDAFAEVGVDPHFFTTRRRDTREPLPWDHIDILVAKAFLKSEWEKALGAGLTADCRFGQCNACGVCDFESITPRIHRHMAPPGEDFGPAAVASKPVYRKLQVFYAKLGPARFFGHLELVNVFLRALRRAGIPVKFSEGFHPKPKVTFNDPLPTGIESEDERMVITVTHEVTPAALLQRLNAQLPEGLHAFACSADIDAPPRCSTFRISFEKSMPEPLKTSIANVDFDRDLVVCSPKGKLKKIALKDILKDIRMSNPAGIDMTLCCEPGKTVRPIEVLKQVFALPPELLGKAGIRKLKDSSHV
jgi:radical SAM-linked protein